MDKICASLKENYEFTAQAGPDFFKINLNLSKPISQDQRLEILKLLKDLTKVVYG